MSDDNTKGLHRGLTIDPVGEVASAKLANYLDQHPDPEALIRGR